MRHLDLQVVSQALEWARAGRALWFCTVLSTYGSAPRAPGAILVASGAGEHVGSLSGGCVEEEFLASLARGELRESAQIVRYGDSAEESRRLRLPCGGVLVVLVEHRAPSGDWIEHLKDLQAALLGQHRLVRHVDLTSGALRLDPDAGQGSERVQVIDETVRIHVGPVLRLILAGLSPVAEACAAFARAIGCEVIACDPREEVEHIVLDGVQAHDEDRVGTLHISTGDAVAQIEPVKPCARCPMPNIDPATALSSPEVNDTLQAYRQDPRLRGAITFGMNAIVLEGDGQVLRVGQRVSADWKFD